MPEPIRFIGRSSRAAAQPGSAGMTGVIGTIHPSALAAMQQTGQASQPGARGSQRFLQGGLSAPITVTWEITAACNIACVHCLSASGKRRPRELTTQWHYLLAMTVITLLPVTLVFAFLQRHITTGIAAAGVK